MELSPRIAEQVEKLPPKLKQLLDAELAAGNEIYSIEFGRGEDAGKVALILNHPFRTKPSDAPASVKYREMLNQDPRIYEFSLDGSLFTLLTAKFKPMKLDPLPPGPENPTEAHIQFMEQRAREEEAAAKERAERAEHPQPLQPPPLDPRTANLSDPAKKFLASMTMTFDMWHHGLAYDLDSLAKIPESERPTIESILINHSPRDWRDIEALARFDSDAARKVVEAAVHSADPQVRQTAMDYAPEKVDPAQREALIIKSLQTDNLFGGLSQTIDEIPDFHPPAVIDALFKAALNRDGESAVHFAALLYFLHGKATKPFDWNHRPFFLRFNTADRKERIAVFRELCEHVGVDSTKYAR